MQQDNGKKRYWLCIELGCGVCIHTSLRNALLYISGYHNHSSNPEKVEVKLVRDKIKGRILSETTPITKIYDEEIVKVNLWKSARAILPTIVEYRT